MHRHATPGPLAILLVVLVTAAAACDGGGGDTDAPVQPGPTPASPTATVDSAADLGTTASPSPPSVPATPSGSPPSGSPSARPPAEASDAQEPQAAPDPAGVALALDEVANLDAPTALAARPGDAALYVAEREGRVRPVDPDGTVGEAVLDISGATTTSSERGLLGLAWSPDGDRLYVSSTDTQGATVLEAVDVVDGELLSSTRTVLLRVPQPAGNHNGGHIAFGPDGHLWLGLGDGGGADDEFGNGQRPDTLLGTMLRLDVEGAGDEVPYAIPPDNPFADGVGGAPEVWAYGLRNPWRFAFDEPTGTLWIADVGQNAVEEINRVAADQAGLNYGWPRFEGDRPFDGQPAEGPVTDPVHTYTHSRGCSITGGVVYRGRAIPQLQGAYLYTDFCNGRIHALVLDAAGAVRADVEVGLSVDSPVSFGEGPDGEVYVLSLAGPVYRITSE